jgi:hypothetical protein
MTRFNATGPRVNYTPQEGPKAGDQLIGLYNMWQSISPETRHWIAGLFKSDDTDEEAPLTTEQDLVNNEMYDAEQVANAGLQRGFDKDFNGQEAFEAAIDAAMRASDDYKASQQAAADAASAAQEKAKQRMQGRQNLGLNWSPIAPYPHFEKGPF